MSSLNKFPFECYIYKYAICFQKCVLLFLDFDIFGQEKVFFMTYGVTLVVSIVMINSA